MKNRVRQLRRELEVSQENLAAAVGVSRFTIINIENQGQEPSLSTALKIAQFFGKDASDIFFADSVNCLQHDSQEGVSSEEVAISKKDSASC